MGLDTYITISYLSSAANDAALELSQSIGSGHHADMVRDYLSGSSIYLFVFFVCFFNIFYRNFKKLIN